MPNQFEYYPFKPQPTQFIPPGTTDLASNALLAILLGIKARAEENRRLQHLKQSQGILQEEAAGRALQRAGYATQIAGETQRMKLAAAEETRKAEIHPSEKKRAEALAGLAETQAKMAQTEAKYQPDILKADLSKKKDDATKAKYELIEWIKGISLREIEQQLSIRKAQIGINVGEQQLKNLHLEAKQITDTYNDVIKEIKAKAEKAQTDAEIENLKLEFEKDPQVRKMRLDALRLANEATQSDINYRSRMSDAAMIKATSFGVGAIEPEKLNAIISDVVNDFNKSFPIDTNIEDREQEGYKKQVIDAIEGAVISRQGLGPDIQGAIAWALYKLPQASGISIDDLPISVRSVMFPKTGGLDLSQQSKGETQPIVPYKTKLSDIGAETIGRGIAGIGKVFTGPLSIGNSVRNLTNRSDLNINEQATFALKHLRYVGRYQAIEEELSEAGLIPPNESKEDRNRFIRKILGAPEHMAIQAIVHRIADRNQKLKTEIYKKAEKKAEDDYSKKVLVWGAGGEARNEALIKWSRQYRKDLGEAGILRIVEKYKQR